MQIHPLSAVEAGKLDVANDGKHLHNSCLI